jgi:hypothetical protein
LCFGTGTKQGACGDNIETSLVAIATKGAACGDSLEVVMAFLGANMNSDALADSLEELGFCLARNALKMAACGDMRGIATVSQVDALMISMGAGVVGVLVWCVTFDYQDSQNGV